MKRLWAIVEPSQALNLRRVPETSEIRLTTSVCTFLVFTEAGTLLLPCSTHRDSRLVGWRCILVCGYYYYPPSETLNLVQWG